MSEVSEFCFFRTGLTAACLKKSGTVPEDRETLNNFRMYGLNRCITLSKKVAGSTSKGQQDGWVLFVRLLRYFRVTGEKSDHEPTSGMAKSNEVAPLTILSLICTILSEKNPKKLLQSIFVEIGRAGTLGETSFFNSVKNNF